MKKRIVSVFLIMVLCLSLAVPVFAASDSTFVVDGADLLTGAEETALSAKLQNLSQTYSAQIVVATIGSLDGADVEDYTRAFYDTMDLGYGGNDDGILLLVAMDVREFRILSMGAVEDAIYDGRIDTISDAISSDLSDGDYADAFDEFADRCEYYLDGYVNGFPFDFGENLVIALVIGLVAGLIVAFVLKAQLKSVRRQNQADVYVKPGSMKLTASHDLFLYRNVSRTKKESSSSSRSRSSRNIGGGSF